MLTIGLTGGIGSGKSSAAELFAEFGATVIDTDEISHRLTGPGGEAMMPIRIAFGEQLLRSDGGLDRDAMRALVFDVPEARNRLEAILHPLIRAEVDRLRQLATGAYVVLVVPLLIESGAYHSRTDRICVVDVPEAVQVERVGRRNGFDEARVRSIMAAQIDRRSRLAEADDVIDNSGDPEHLRQQVEALHARYLRLAREGADYPR